MLNSVKEKLMVKIEPFPSPAKLLFIEYVKQLFFDYGYSSEPPTLADLENSDPDSYLMMRFEKFQSEELRKIIFEEYFNGDWRSGQEISKVVITHRLHQISHNSTQA